MQVSYKEYKAFLCNLYRFVQERNSETLKCRTQNYIDNNVIVTVPDVLYQAVENYTEEYTEMIDILNELTEPKIKRTRRKVILKD